MAETGLRIPMTLPCGWERRSLARHELENLWGEALMILRVINQMEAHAPREGEADAALARLEAKVDRVCCFVIDGTNGHGDGHPRA